MVQREAVLYQHKHAYGGSSSPRAMFYILFECHNVVFQSPDEWAVQKGLFNIVLYKRNNVLPKARFVRITRAILGVWV